MKEALKRYLHLEGQLIEVRSHEAAIVRELSRLHTELMKFAESEDDVHSDEGAA